MCNFTGILRLVNHGTSRSIFLIANFLGLISKVFVRRKVLFEISCPMFPPKLIQRTTD